MIALSEMYESVLIRLKGNNDFKLRPLSYTSIHCLGVTRWIQINYKITVAETKNVIKLHLRIILSVFKRLHPNVLLVKKKKEKKSFIIMLIIQCVVTG